MHQPQPSNPSIKKRSGRKPSATIAETKKFAERMGYRSQTNEHPDPAYNLFFQSGNGLHRPGPAYSCGIDPDAMYEDLIPDDLRDVRALPYPAGFPK
jgi:hypothetical protein